MRRLWYCLPADARRFAKAAACCEMASCMFAAGVTFPLDGFSAGEGLLGGTGRGAGASLLN